MRSEMMRPTISLTAARRRLVGATVTQFAVMSVLLLAALPLVGCGGGKKPTMTIADRLRRAEAQPTPDGQAREFARIARLQLQSADNSGAEKTVGRARQVYLEMKMPVREAVPEEAAPEPAADAPAAEPAPEPAPDTPAADTPAADTPAAEPPAAEDAAAAAEPPASPPINAAIWGPLLVEIAAVYADAGSKGPARDVLKDAASLAPEIGDDVSRASLLAGIGGIYGSQTSGDTALARANLKKAAQLAEGVESRFRAEALAAVAMGYVKAGLAKEAGDMVATLERSAREVESPRARAEGLAAAANVRALAGDADAATRLLGDAADAAKGIEGAENRTYALVAVANATADAGDRKGALSLVAEAEKSANRVPDPDAQKNALERVRQLKTEIERRR
jgi:hypothetical protein